MRLLALIRAMLSLRLLSALAALLMGVVMWFANDLFRPYTTGPSLHRWGAMLVLVSAGALVYFAATFLFGAFRMADVRRLVRR